MGLESVDSLISILSAPHVALIIKNPPFLIVSLWRKNREPFDKFKSYLYNPSRRICYAVNNGGEEMF